MGRRINYPCKICKGNINLKTISDDDIMWSSDEDEIAHRKCLPEDYDTDKWLTTNELYDVVELDE